MPTPAGLHWGLPAWPTPSPGRARSRWQLQLGSLLTEGIPRGAALDLRPGRMVPEGPPQAQFVQGGLSLALCSAPLRVGRHRAGASAGPLRQLRASWPQWGWDGSHSVWGAPAQLSGGCRRAGQGGMRQFGSGRSRAWSGASRRMGPAPQERRHTARTRWGQEHEQKPAHPSGPGALLPLGGLLLTGTIRTTLLSGIEDATADPQLSVPRAPPAPNPRPGASCIPVNRVPHGLVLGRMDNMMHQ